MQQTDLDQLAAADTGSREQMSIDQLFRSRLQFALAQSAALFAQVQFADAKAGTLLALIGLLAAHVAGGGIDAGVWEMRALLALNALVIAACVMVLVPRIPTDAARKTMARTDRFSWPALTGEDYTAEDHADFVRTAQASQLIVSVGRSNAAVAAILQQKYRMLRMAFGAAALDVAATLLVAAFGK